MSHSAVALGLFWAVATSVPALEMSALAATPAVPVEATDAAPLSASRNADHPVPVPGKQAAELALDRVRNVFAREYAAATTAPRKADLAKRLVDQLPATTAPADRWALTIEALRFATDAGDAATAVPLIEAMKAEFAIGGLAAEFDALSRLSSRVSGRDLVDVTTALIRLSTAASAGRHDEEICVKAMALAASLARKSRSPSLIDEVTRAQKRMRADQQVVSEVNQLLQVARADPNDHRKVLAAGLALCFKADRWKEGLSLIAQGPPSAIAELAKVELANPDDPKTVVLLADGWAEWAASQKPPYSEGAIRHAAGLYQAALPRLSGLDKVRVEKQLEQCLLGPVGSAGAAYLADLPETAVTGATFGFSKDGTYMGKPFRCADKAWPKAIAAIPGGTEAACVRYQVPASVSRIQGRVGVFSPPDAKENQQPGAPLTFEVVADGRVVWRSSPIARRDDVIPFRADIRGSAGIELRTQSASGYCAWGAWLDPQLIR